MQLALISCFLLPAAAAGTFIFGKLGDLDVEREMGNASSAVEFVELSPELLRVGSLATLAEQVQRLSLDALLVAQPCRRIQQFNRGSFVLSVPTLSVTTELDCPPARKHRLLRQYPVVPYESFHALRDVLQKIDVDKIVVLVDDSGFYDQFVRPLTKLQVNVKVNRVDNGPGLGSMLDRFVESAAELVKYENTKLTGLIACSNKCQRMLFSRMNDLERTFPGRMAMRTRWLVVQRPTEDSAGGPSIDLTKVIGTMDHVVTVVESRVTHTVERDVLASNVAAIFRNATREFNDLEYEYDEAPDFATVFLKTIDAQPDVQRHRFIISSAFYGPDSVRFFRPVATWTPLKGLDLVSRIFSNEYFGFNNRNFSVATMEWQPFVAYNREQNLWSGLCIDMLKELAREYNFTYVLRTREDGIWGTRNPVTGNWNGLFGMVTKRQVDMLVAPVSASPERIVAAKFSEPYFIDYHTVMARLPSELESKWTLYTSPFQWKVWMCLVIAVPAAGVMLWLFTVVSPYYEFDRNTKNLHGGLAKLDNSMIYTIGSIFSQGGVFTPEAQSGRFFLGFWWIFCIVMVATYSGNLIAFLTVSKSTLPFQTIDQLLNRSGYRIGAVGNSITTSELSQTHISRLMRLNERIQEMWIAEPELASVSFDDHLSQLLTTARYAYIGDRAGIERAMSVHCSLDRIKDTFIPLAYSIILPLGSTYGELLSKGIMMIKEGGLVTKWLKASTPRSAFCERGMITSARAVSLGDVQGGYYVAGFLLCTAVALLLVEFVARQTRLELSSFCRNILRKNHHQQTQ